MDNRQFGPGFRQSDGTMKGLHDSTDAGGDSTTEGQSKTITVLMSDIPRFSAFAERTTAAALARQLVEYRDAMARVIAAHGGTVMQFLGDTLIAVFGAQVPRDDHAAAGVAAAVQMQASGLTLLL